MRTLLFGLALVTACGTDFTPDLPPAPTPRATWYQDVAPIVAQHCMGCHQDGGIAPFSLTDYDDAVSYSNMMITQTQAGTMPPFYAREEPSCTPRFGWKDDPRLSAAELQTLQVWVEDGAAEGKVAAVPPPPVTDLPNVTQTVKPLTPFVAEGDRDEFMCTILDPGNTSLMWLDGLQVRPGNANVVHHVVVTEMQAGADLDAMVAANGIGLPFNCDGMATPSGFVVSIWTPGNEPMQTPADLAVPITAGAKLVMQIHYHPAGRVNAADATSIDLRTTTTWPTRMYFVTAVGNAFEAPQLLSDPDDASPLVPEFVIPANKPDHTESMTFTIPDLGGLTDVRVYSVNAHMHLLGTHIASEIDRIAPTATQPSSECLANGGWNFDWQRTYIYNAALDDLPSIQMGDVVNVQCHWDNTMDNPFEQRLLADAGLVAPTDVTLGEQTTNEMCLAIFGLSVPAPAQPTAREAPVDLKLPTALFGTSALR